VPVVILEMAVLGRVTMEMAPLVRAVVVEAEDKG
jgi:hypothetical protein